MIVRFLWPNMRCSEPALRLPVRDLWTYDAYFTLVCFLPAPVAELVMHSPQLASSRRKSWREIAAYYEAAAQQPAMGNWARLRDFALAVEQKPYAQALVSVGSLGGIFVFKDPECVAQRGYFMIGCSPTGERGDIRFGFFTEQEHDTAKLTSYGDAESAAQAFERGLEEHGFI